MSYRHIKDDHMQARNERACDLCGLPITRGTTYVRRCGEFEGRFDIMSMHMGCEEVTRTWGITEWENRGSEAEFREEKARYYASKGGEK